MSRSFASAVLLLFASLLGCGTAIIDNDEVKADGTRVIHFPTDRSIGRYYIFHPDKRADNIAEDQLRNARGDVSVPAGMEVALLFADATLNSDEKPIDLSPLDRLRPTDIQAFGVQPFMRVSAEELKRLRRHVSLRVVAIGGLNNINNDCLAPLSELKSLEVLQLPEATITDKGLAHLEGLVHLKLLNLYGTKVTDAGLRYLHRMSELKSLNLRNTQVTDVGAKEIQQALPQCVVKR